MPAGDFCILRAEVCTALHWERKYNMKFDEFTELVREKLQEKCEADETVNVCTVLKNNSKKLTGVMIKKSDTEISPTLYLEDCFEEYCDGCTLDDIVCEIKNLSSNSATMPVFSVEKFRDWDYMKDRILYKLINTDRNTEFLGQVPHREFLNLSVVYYVRIENSANAYATTVIHNEHADYWDVSEDELFKHAYDNTRRLMPGIIRCMNDILSDILKSDICCESDTDALRREITDGQCIDMFVATNRDNMYGAGVMLDDELLQSFARLHGNFYILPSSIHELIFVPDNMNYKADDLLDMVRNVNETEVDDVDVLSDDIYYYNIDSETQLKLIKSEWMYN